MAMDSLSGNPTIDNYPGPSGGGDYVDLHELAKGWKAAIARAKDPVTK
jgi:hypothetical protein